MTAWPDRAPRVGDRATLTRTVEAQGHRPVHRAER